MDVRRRCAALPIFPLPRVVLMPGDSLPLHVFEPRYRALLADCLRDDRLMGIATLLPGRPDVADRPAIAADLGVGRVIAHEPYPDGRSNIVVQHVARARIVRELPSPHAYRVVEAEVCEDVPPTDDLVRLRALVLQLAASTPSSASDAQRVTQLEPAFLVDELARRVLDDADERLRYVSLDTIDARARMIEEYLGALYLATHPPEIEA